VTPGPTLITVSTHNAKPHNNVFSRVIARLAPLANARGIAACEAPATTARNRRSRTESSWSVAAKSRAVRFAAPPRYPCHASLPLILLAAPRHGCGYHRRIIQIAPAVISRQSPPHRHSGRAAVPR